MHLADDLQERDQLTRFGATVMSLCAEHGLSTRQALVEKLERAGYTKLIGGKKQPRYSHARIGNWFYGRHAADRHFCLALRDSLGLTQAEQDRLADAFTFGQDEDWRGLEKAG